MFNFDGHACDLLKSIIAAFNADKKEAVGAPVVMELADWAGCYDALVRSVHRRVQSEQSNCLLHAYAISRNTWLPQDMFVPCLCNL